MASFIAVAFLCVSVTFTKAFYIVLNHIMMCMNYMKALILSSCLKEKLYGKMMIAGEVGGTEQQQEEKGEEEREN